MSETVGVTMAVPGEGAPALQSATDEEIAAAGDASSFERLYRRHLDVVYRYVASRVTTRDAAEDVTSDAFQRAWAGLDGYRGKGTFKAWLFGIVRRTLADHFRGHARSIWLDPDTAETLVDARPGPEEQAIDRERRRQAQRLLAALSPEQQEVLHLRLRGRADLFRDRPDRRQARGGGEKDRLPRPGRDPEETDRMSNAYKSELDQKLAEAEQAALPLVHAAMTHEPMRAAFPTELAHRLRAAGADGAGARRPRVHLAWRWRGLSPARAGIAVALATTLVVVGGILYPRLTSTSAAAVLDGIQREAGATPGGITFTTNGAARSCPPAGGPITSAGSARGATTGAVVAAVSNPGVGTPQPGTPVAGARVVSIAFPGSPPPGKATGGAQVVSIGGPGSPEDEIGPASVNPTEVSDRLGQALGVSGQRVRDAMRQALDSVDPPPALPDPIAGLAQQLGKTREEVESAFTNPDCPEAGAVISVTFPVTADQLSGPAQRLGVTPDRLAAALRAVLPPPTGKPPSEEELIHRMAADLGVSDAQLRAAITKVEGPDRAYFFSIPLPSLGKP